MSKTTQIDVYEIGSEVCLGENITATINAVTISGDGHNVQYECVWWSEGARNVEWVRPREINQPVNTRRIGFLEGRRRLPKQMEK